MLAFAPGSGPQFALLPPDNATGNFTKVVQRVAVKIVIDDADGLADRLRPGMSVVAKVDARGQRPMSDAAGRTGRRPDAGRPPCRNGPGRGHAAARAPPDDRATVGAPTRSPGSA